MVRDNEGQWSLPQFVTLTGGSVGWQAGVEASDVVLVFTTQKGVQNLLHGQFTIGADIAAAAGPIGRNAAAATDGQLKAEILSYSRSRGLFLGVSLDGSAIEIDEAAHDAFYGSPSSQIPRQVPQPALQLRQDLMSLAPTPLVAAPVAAAAIAAPLPDSAAPAIAAPAHGPNPARLLALRAALDKNSRALMAIVPSQWQQYLALPKPVYDVSQQPELPPLTTALSHYDAIAKSADYKQLAARPEFQSTHETLRAFVDELSLGANTTLALPPPPQG